MTIARAKPTSPLWYTIDGVPLTYYGVGGIIRAVEEQTGVDFSSHRFRHTFATTMAHSGVTGVDLMNMLGHTNISTTLKYLHADPDHLQDVHRPNSPLDNQDKVEIRRRGRPKKGR